MEYLIQMINYGEAKNQIDQLRRLLTQINALKPLGITVRSLEEEALRDNNPQIFLRLAHYLLASSSESLFMEIIKIVPNYVLTDDRKFVENTFLIARKLLFVQSMVTVEQFLSEKFFEKKLAFAVELTKAVGKWASDHPKPLRQPANFVEQLSDEDEPRSINIQPTRMPPVLPVSRQVRQLRRDKDVERVPVKDVERVPVKDVERVPVKEVKAEVKLLQEEKLLQESSSERDEGVSREEFNEALELLGTINTTVSNMAQKFNSFQSSVMGWVNNINAKMSILEDSLKLIKANL